MESAPPGLLRPDHPAVQPMSWPSPQAEEAEVWQGSGRRRANKPGSKGSKEATMPLPNQMRSSVRPGVSVVVATRTDAATLHACLATLVSAVSEDGVNIVVAHTRQAAEIEMLRMTYPDAVFVSCAPDASIAQLRVAGMRAASGDVVAITETECGSARDWLHAVLSCIRRSSAV